jgi:hypothetical protein
LGAYNRLVANNAKANELAITAAAKVQHDQDMAAEKAAVTEAAAQQRIVIQTKTLTKEIVTHVPVTVACVPVGLVRVLNAAAKGLSAPDESFAAGKSDDACAPVSWRSLAADISDDYGTGNENAEQLNALEASIRDINAAGTGASSTATAQQGNPVALTP